MTDEQKRELAFRKEILNAKIAQISEKCYCISEIKELQFVNDDTIWEKEGKNDFHAIAEIFWETNTEGGVHFSTGTKIKIKGTMEKRGQEYILDSPIMIESNVNTRDIKVYTNEHSNI